MRLIALVLCALVASACSGPLQRGVAAYEQGNYSEAARQWREDALRGDAFAQNNMGVLAERGFDGSPPDYAQAEFWYRKSAAQDYVPAMVQLARVLSATGRNAESTRWLERAARWGDRESLATLRRLGVEPPPADLQAEYERESALTESSIRKGLQ